MPRHHIVLRSGLTLLVILLAGCSTPTKVASSWHTEADRLASDQILVVGVSQELSTRRLFEDRIVERLQRGNTRAWASSRHMDSSAPLNKDSVATAVTATGATMVVVTRLVDQQVNVGEVDSRSGVQVARKNETPLDFFRYDYNEYDEPAYLVVKSNVGLATDVYRASDGELIYSIDTISYDTESKLDVIEDASKAIAARLRRDGLVR